MEGLGIRPKRPRRRVTACRRMERVMVTEPNGGWSMDFMSDELFDGQRIRPFTIVDNFSRQSLAIEVGERIGGQRVVEVLMQLGKERGLPKTIRLDNGPEIISLRLEQWAHLNGVGLDFSRPGKPMDNGLIGALN